VTPLAEEVAATWAATSQLWHSAPRRWGNRLHAICSYMAMFPPALPHVFIRWLTEPGDIVYDPFSGRGTTGLEASLLRRQGLLSDASPLAVVLSGAKVDPPSPRALGRRLRYLKRTRDRLDPSGEPEHVQMLFAPETLGQLLWLRRELNPSRRTDRYILALLLGGLHARQNNDGSVAGLTVAMPNTFSMSPGYIAKYIGEHDLIPPRWDVIEFIEKRLARFPPPHPGVTRGRAWNQSATQSAIRHFAGSRAKLIFASPPYLSVVKYGKLNWIRLWLLGHTSAEVDDELFSSGSTSRYAGFMTQCIKALRQVLADDGYICLVIGDVVRGDD
jgi:hypothetical protein